MCNCHSNIDGFDNFTLKGAIDKITTVKNNTIQNIKAIPTRIVTGFAGGNAGNSSYTPDFETPTQPLAPINIPAASGLSTGAIIGISVAGLAVVGLLTAVIIKVSRKGK